ncbi:MAG: hypothetical protein C4336_03605 [Armatimonadota bacterium]
MCVPCRKEYTRSLQEKGQVSARSAYLRIPPERLNCLTRRELIDRGSTVIDGKVRYRWAEKHPARFIPQVPEKFIKLFSHQGETVLDPFCGSGTTNGAALQLGHSSIGDRCSSPFGTNDLRTPPERNIAPLRRRPTLYAPSSCQRLRPLGYGANSARHYRPECDVPTLL